MRNIRLTPILYSRPSNREDFMRGPISPLTPQTFNPDFATEELERLEVEMAPIAEPVLRDMIEGEQ